MNKKEPQNPSEILDALIEFFSETNEDGNDMSDKELTNLGLNPEVLNTRISHLIQAKQKEIGLAQLKKAHDERLAVSKQVENENPVLPEKRESLIEAIKELASRLSGGSQLQLSWRNFENVHEDDLKILLKSLHELNSQSKTAG